MSDNSSPIGLNHLDAGARAPGEILRAAREAQGLSLDQLAATLKVAPAKLAALETGRIEQLPDASFARALAQTMCRVLKIEAAPVLAGLPAARVAPLAADKPALNQPFKEARLAPSMFETTGVGLWGRLMRPQWFAPIALLLAAAAIYLLPESFEWPRWRVEDAPQVAASQASAPEPVPEVRVPEPAASGALVLDPAPSSASASFAASGVAQGASGPLAAASSAADVGTSAGGPVGVAPSALGAVASATVVPSKVESGEPVALSVSEDSWIEVIDGAGNTRLSRIVRAGEALSMGGVSPWRVRIGHVGGVKVTLRGQPVDLSPYARNNVARLELK